MEIKITEYREEILISSRYSGETITLKEGEIIEVPSSYDWEPSAIYMVDGETEMGEIKASKIANPKVPADFPMPEIAGIKVEKKGQSGIAARNSWVAVIPTTTASGYMAKKMEDGGLFDDYRELVPAEGIEIPDPQKTQEVMEKMRRQRNDYFGRLAVKKVEELMGSFDAVVISEFNKAPYFSTIPKGFLGFVVKNTSCGNITACIIRKQPAITVPGEIKGLVIGKGGRRIKELGKKAGFRIQVR